MSDHKPKKTIGNKAPRAFGWMAEYSDEHRLLEASRKVRDSGYTETDAFTPFPVHGIDEALGIKPTKLPFIVLCCGLTGLSLALLMQWWMNGVDYMYIISGKPFGITPASIPVAFEMTILFSAFSTFLGMIALNKLPRFSNPVFTNPRFDRATDDKFFLYVNAQDKYYNRESVRELLAATKPDSLDEVIEDSSPSTLPRFIWLTTLLVVLAGLIPAMVILNMRGGYSTAPRFHVFFDMDFQPKKKAQQQTTVFADGRTMRPQVAGTIARGQLDQQDSFHLGYDPDKVAALSVSTGRFVSLDQEGDKPQTGEGQPPVSGEPKPEQDKPVADKPAEEKPAEAKPAEDKPAQSQEPAAKPAETQEKPADAPKADAPKADAPKADAAAAPAAPPALNLPWLEKLPIEANETNMKLGETKFRTYCSACHGYGGNGDGLVHKRAEALAQGYWIPPTSLHADRVRTQPVGQIFHTISKGQNKMPGYANALTPQERWAIVLYVKALQRSRNASLEDIPVDKRSSIEDVTVVPAETKK